MKSSVLKFRSANARWLTVNSFQRDVLISLHDSFDGTLPVFSL